jgi:hypothetical protein
MKIRQGFVSNSSSSSFIFVLKKEIDLKEKIKQLLKLPEDSPFSSITKDIADIVVENSEPTDIKEYIEDYFYDTDEYPEYCGKVMAKEWELFTGSFSDEEGDLSAFLCNYFKIDYEDEDIIFIKEAGY